MINQSPSQSLIWIFQSKILLIISNNKRKLNSVKEGKVCWTQSFNHQLIRIPLNLAGKRLPGDNAPKLRVLLSTKSERRQELNLKRLKLTVSQMKVRKKRSNLKWRLIVWTVKANFLKEHLISTLQIMSSLISLYLTTLIISVWVQFNLVKWIRHLLVHPSSKLRQLNWILF